MDLSPAARVEAREGGEGHADGEDELDGPGEHRDGVGVDELHRVQRKARDQAWAGNGLFDVASTWVVQNTHRSLGVAGPAPPRSRRRRTTTAVATTTGGRVVARRRLHDADALPAGGGPPALVHERLKFVLQNVRGVVTVQRTAAAHVLYCEVIERREAPGGGDPGCGRSRMRVPKAEMMEAAAEGKAPFSSPGARSSPRATLNHELVAEKATRWWRGRRGGRRRRRRRR